MPFWTSFQVYRWDQFACLCFSWISVTTTPHNILSKPLAAFSLNNRRTNCKQGDENESCRNYYRQSQEGNRPSRGSNQQPPVLKSCTLPAGLLAPGLGTRRGGKLHALDKNNCRTSNKGSMIWGWFHKSHLLVFNTIIYTSVRIVAYP